jgi:hypothetical protein
MTVVATAESNAAISQQKHALLEMRVLRQEAYISEHAATIAGHAASIESLNGMLRDMQQVVWTLRDRLDAADAKQGPATSDGDSAHSRALTVGVLEVTRITGGAVMAPVVATAVLNVSRTLYVDGDVFFNGKKWDPEWFPTSVPTPFPSNGPTPLPTEVPFPAPTSVPVPLPTKVPIPSPTPAPCTTLAIGPVGPNPQGTVMSLKNYCIAAGYAANGVVGNYCWYYASNYAGPVGCVNTFDGYPRLSTPCSVRTWDDSGCGTGDTTIQDACARGNCVGDNPGYRIRIMCQCP